MTIKPDIIVTEPVPPIVSGLQPAFTLHGWWAIADRAAFLAETGPRIRAIAVGPKAKIDAELIAALPALEIISKFGVGYETIDTAAAAARGVIVTNTPDVVTDEVADFALGLLVAAVRQIPQAMEFLKGGRWGPGKFFGLTSSLRGRKAGIVGLGRIGKAIARRCEGFGLPVAYHGRTEQPNVPYRFYDSLLDLARDVDTLFIAASGGAQTAGLVNAEVLRALGPEGIVINVARGSIIDEPALIAALQNKTILAAALDSFAAEPSVPAELLAMGHLVLTPHVAAGSLKTVLAMSKLVVDNLNSWFAGSGPLTPVVETPWRGSAAPR